MREYTKPTFECDFCKKIYKMRHFAIRHEKYCAKNPNNFHKCFHCNHLEVEITAASIDSYSEKTFRCTLLSIDLHSFKAEKINHSCLGSTERMPLDCKHYEDDTIKFFKQVEQDEIDSLAK